MWCELYKQEVAEITCQFCSAYCSKRRHDETIATNKTVKKK